MLAIKAKFDGKQIILPKRTKGLDAGEVVVIFDAPGKKQPPSVWRRMQEETLAEVWENDEDAAYDKL